MRIRVLRNLGAGLPDFQEGHEYEVDRPLGETLCARHLAVDVTTRATIVPEVIAETLKAEVAKAEAEPRPRPRRPGKPSNN